MNPRVIELLKNPKNIQSEDLHLLKEEINSFPYVQNIRALHLYGVHLYDKENYQKELTTTAAYTTDKKILYQLINGKIQERLKVPVIEEKGPEINKNTFRYIYQNSNFPIKRVEKPEEKEDEKISCILLKPQPEIKHIYVNGERNRILFEGEENFLDQKDTETIDLESTLESGTLVTQKQEKQEPEQKENEGSNHKVDLKNNIEEINEFTPEKIINEEKISSETIKEEVTDSSEVSFHGMESFMPDVKIQSGNSEEIKITEISQSNINKHEEEMRRLIEEVEKKMKANKESFTKKEKEPEPTNHEISFAETQSFHIAPPKQNTEEMTEEKPLSGEIPESPEESEEQVVEARSGWKPMSIESNTPDSLISKKAEFSQEKSEAPKAEISNQKEVLPEVEKQSEEPENKFQEVQQSETLQEKPQDEKKNPSEAPVMNVSFFSSDISSWNVESEKEDIKKTAEKTDQKVTDSNIPGFINTWQNWLKIDRSEEIEKLKTESKIKAIDNFIENNPKISQLKEDGSYVIKEKTDDISHLMTETLANLYFEQKLYTKAIRAFEILIRKNPEKKDYFEAKIQKIKDFRSRN